MNYFMLSANYQQELEYLDLAESLNKIAKGTAAETLKCLNCYSTPPEGNRCSGCREARYCNAECQKADWKNHKVYCGQTSLPDLLKQELRRRVVRPTAAEIAAFAKEHLQEFLDPNWQPYGYKQY